MSLYAIDDDKYEVTLGYDEGLGGYFWLIVHSEFSDNESCDDRENIEIDGEDEEHYLFHNMIDRHDLRMTINDIREALKRFNLYVPATLLKVLYQEAKEKGFFTDLNPADFEPKSNKELETQYY